MNFKLEERLIDYMKDRNYKNILITSMMCNS